MIMKCVLPGRGIKGNIEPPSSELIVASSFEAFGKAIFCLAKLGDDLYIEALKDGVSLLHCMHIIH